jgi:hypothetical protein
MPQTVKIVKENSRFTIPEGAFTALLERRFNVTKGRKMNQPEGTWTDQQIISWPDLRVMCTDHREGPKDGTCICPATFSAGKRAAAAAIEIHLACLDSDSGHSLEEIETAIQRNRWAAVVYSTHSHMTTTTTITLKRFRESPDAESYLRDKKGYLPHLCTGATMREVPPDAADDYEVTIDHKPIPKFRIVLPLKKPWRVVDFENFEAAKTAWTRAYKILIEHLGLKLDASGGDLNRLFFLPRHAPRRPFDTKTIDGGPCSIFTLIPDPRMFDFNPEPENRKPDPEPEPKPTGGDEGSVIAAFNRTHTPESLLEKHGYRKEEHSGKWLSPHSTSKQAGVSVKDGRIFSHHGDGDPLSKENCDGHAHDSFSAFCILAHGGDQRTAVRAAAAIMGMNGKRDAAGATMQSDPEELRKSAKRILSQFDNQCGEFDLSALPEPVREYVEAQASTTGAPTITILSAFLTSNSGFSRQNRYIPEADFSEDSGGYFQRLYANIWTLDIARSGAFKTTAQRKGARFAFERQREVRREIFELKQEHIKKGLSPSEEDQKAFQKAVAEAARRDVLLPNKITAEALIEHLSQGFAGTILCSEFGEWLETLEKSHNAGLKALFTELYDVPELYRYKTKTGGMVEVEQPFISIHGVSTLDWIQKNIKPADVSSGFFARFLIFNPPHKDVIPDALPTRKQGVNLDTVNTIRAVLQSLPEGEIAISEDAQALFCEFHSSLYREFYSFDERIRGILDPYVKRWSPYVLKLGMNLEPFFAPRSRSIGPEAIVAAISVVEYAIQSTLHLFKNELGETDHQRKQRLVLHFIAKRGGSAPWGKLLSSHTLDGGTADYAYVVQTLVESGILNEEQKPKKSNWVYSLSGV